MKQWILDGDNLTLKTIEEFVKSGGEISISQEAIERIKLAHNTVLDIIKTGKSVYGINTGFGKLGQIKIPPNELEILQLNLLRSHAAGIGEIIDTKIISLMMLLKVNNLSAGYSGCSLDVVKKLVELHNKGIFPVIPEKGSVGASGDLAPLAHMSLPLIGEGKIFYKNKKCKSEELIQHKVYQPVSLSAKDGLSLINGTQYSTALLSLALIKSMDLLLLSELAAAMSIEAVLASDVPFRREIQDVRRQVGQKVIASHIRQFLLESEIIKSHKNCEKIQDPYSFRCVPQVLGAVRDTINYVRSIAENELNAVTDNPLVFSDTGEVLSGGNFHAEPLALAADQLAIAITEIGNISERRIATLIDPSMSSLPPFLIESTGINSGFMIAQVTAAAITSENRALSHPASVDNVTTSANQEDHVSMAPYAGMKLLKIVNNVEDIIWIEMLAAAQGMDFRRPLKGGIGSELGYTRVRSIVKHLDKDRLMYEDLQKGRELFDDYQFIDEIKNLADRDNER